MIRPLALCLAVASGMLSAEVSARSPLKVLFLGDNGHHRPADRAKQLIPIMATRDIAITYTDRLTDLNPQTLSGYDGLIIYANSTKIEPAQEQALLDFVGSGKGFIPLHCASYCFLNSPAYIALVGAQFKSHGTGEFYTRVVNSEHPIMKDVWEFRTWDETYVHTKHNEDRTVLQVRTEGGRDEPWTWVRNYKRGRVFYTAYGHDHRTWGAPGFHALVERGIRWACGDDRVVDNGLKLRKDVEPFKYTPAKLPNYLKGRNWGTQGAPLDRMQLPIRPAESMKHMSIPRGFRVELFASDPDITKPIAMAWDIRGRLWIAETIDYPNDLQPEDRGNDRIKICEDTDGDGRADKFTVFADKLSIPTSLLFARGGLIVHQAPHTLFLKDTDGDDRADERKIMFSGWSTGDTHAGPSNMNYGFDNWVWGMVGYSGFRGKVGDEQHSFRTGFYRFKPDGSQLEFIRNTNNNSWGVSFTEDGLLFGSTANGNPSVFMPIPNRYYEAVRGWSSSRLERTAISAKFYPITELVRQVDHHGNFTAAAGHAIYTARSFPKYYWNRTAFVNGPTGHLLATFLLDRVGSDFVTRNSWNLLASNDEWTAPIMAEVGPDGAVWMIDWYNYIVQHNPTPRGFRTGKGNAYVTELRDKTHGRIYRIIWEKAAPAKPMRLDKATPSDLVTTLGHENLLWRKHAQRLLVERGKDDVDDELIQLVGNKSVDEIGLSPAATHALWTLHGIGALDGSNAGATRAATGALRHPAAGVRRAALKVLPRDGAATKAIIEANSLADRDAHVRLAAFLALAEMPSSAAAGKAVADALTLPENANDRWIPHATTSAAARHSGGFLRSVAAAKNADANTLEVVRRVAEHHARGAPVDTAPALVVGLATASTSVADAVVEGFVKGWPSGEHPQLTADQEKALLKVLTVVSPTVKGQLVKLAGRWNARGLETYTEEIAKDLLAEASDAKRASEKRLDAARQLVEFRSRDGEVAAELFDLIQPRTPPEVVRGSWTRWG